MNRIWIISELFPPEETSTAYIMGEIADAFTSKYDVSVICGPEVYDHSRIGTIDNEKIHKYNLNRAKIKSFNKNTIVGKTKSFIFTTIALFKIARKKIKPGDKVLMVTNPAPLILLLSILRHFRNFEFNILVHDVFPENTKAANIKLPIYGFVKWLFNSAYLNADRLIAIGHDMAEILKEKTKGKVPVSIIENWGDFEKIRPLEMPKTRKIILEYAGNIGRVQGLEEVVECLPADIEFHLYGSGALVETLKQKKKSNIFFHGPFARKNQTDILGACHISLVTLNNKMYGLGTPSKTYNILASGRPILYFGPKGSEIDLLLTKYKIGYTDWPEAWNFDELEQMGRRARAIGEQLYSKRAILNKFLKTI